MSKTRGAVAVGIILACAVLYVIRPVNVGAIGLVTTVCCGLVAGIMALLRGKGRRDAK